MKHSGRTSDPPKNGTTHVAFYHATPREASEQVQRGLRSCSYDTGRFSTRRENGVHHFQSLVLDALRETP